MRAVFERTLKPPYVRVRAAVNAALERRAGIRTLGELQPEELGFDGDHRQRYKPAGWTQLRRILPRREVTPGDVFLDLGSGMGRVVYQAAWRYPFRRVVGVELSPELTAVAQENVERNRHRLRCRDVELVCSDVLEFEIPDDVTVVYMNNPFTGPIFGTVVERLLASVERVPRELRLIYANPVEEPFLLGTSRFERVRRLRGMRPGRDWSRSNSVCMYREVPPR